MGYIGYSLITILLWGFGSKLVAKHFSPVSAAPWSSLMATLCISDRRGGDGSDSHPTFVEVRSY